MNWGQPIRSNFSITEASAAPMPEVQPAALLSGSIRSLVASSIARKALADHGLSGQLSVLRGAGDPITINGDLPADMRQQWRLARAEIDALSEDAVILYEFEMSSGMPKIPAISSVRLDVNPGLIFADQTELQVGDILPGGWRLDEINDVGFQLTRQDKSVLIEY
jgi:hypothetical protein